MISMNIPVCFLAAIGTWAVIATVPWLLPACCR
jgi:hypothetical protein